MALPVQITKIKIAQKELCLSESDYRSFLSNWGVKSCTRLSIEQANEALDRLKEMGWVPKPGKNKSKGTTGAKKYEELRGRSSEFGVPQQLRLIEILWHVVARIPNEKTLESFVHRQTKIRKLEWLKKNHVEAVLCALEAMYRNTSDDQIASRTELMIPRDQQFLKENLVRIKEVRYAK